MARRFSTFILRSSLGGRGSLTRGRTAASLADQDERVEGLVLLASYPADMIIRNDLKVVSISGTADGLDDTGRHRGLQGETSA